jgi:hypothetical protein
MLMLLPLLAAPAIAGTVYKWTDERGVVHFGDVPPAPATGIRSETMPAAPPPVARPPQPTSDAPSDGAAAVPPGAGAEAVKEANVAVTDRQAEAIGPAAQSFRGKVKNQGGTEARDVFVAIVVTEPTQGDECLREEIDVEPSTLAPGAEGTFEAEFDNPCFHGPITADLSPEWR